MQKKYEIQQTNHQNAPRNKNKIQVFFKKTLNQKNIDSKKRAMISLMLLITEYFQRKYDFFLCNVSVQHLKSNNIEFLVYNLFDIGIINRQLVHYVKRPSLHYNANYNNTCPMYEMEVGKRNPGSESLT